jgi:small subunit ribosomal protein S16
MAVHVRLKRTGKNPKKKPHFRIAAFDERRGRDSRFIEQLGFYNPVSKAVKIDSQRLDYWVKNGAQVSQTIKGLMKKIAKEAAHAAGTSS